MEKFHCQKCGRTSYSADRHITECPHCRVERLLVINPELVSLAGEFSNAKVIIDRRSSKRAVDVERRKTCSKGVPLGWFCYSEKE